MRTLIASMCLVLGGCGAAGAGDGGSEGSSEDGSTSGGPSTDTPTTTAATATTTSATTVGETTAPEATTDEPGDTTEADDATSETGDVPATCDVAMPLAPGDYERTIAHDGAMRSYFLHVPATTEPTAPLVVNMHGFLSNPTMQSDWSELNASADARGIVTAHPQGLGNSWNAGACCGSAAGAGVDDVGFIRAVVADIAQVTCVDARRVYATGLSNGGFMSNRLGCEASDLFAAVAPVVGALVIPLEDCNPTRPMPVFAFNGVQDSLVAYDQGVATIDRWVEVDGCDPEPAVEELDGGHCETWSGCDGDAEVRFCTLDPMGHCWPGGDPALCYDFIGPHSDAVDATERMLDFFEAHPMP